ncbi:hypothetical protein [Corynebacterium heidelbergense]|uniref:Holin n=1 Tax=Corynebacterium heidelbergense TaxID=2055947 RepID=A0A364VEE8_9CORY|nr:hypothetical protein [Corynebacterium heidelbergense]RAV34936.1 hypothetical protein CWC39_00945 [Corynebacterium heidelbergense]WCZ36075.1 hypothetical protein CHEID_02545 [Corynebacterium heidelbergense]
MKKNFAAPWFIRRALYLVVGAVLLGLAAFGVISEAQIDSISAQVTGIVGPLLGALVSGWAASKTHEGSDSTVTVDDVERAANANITDKVIDVIAQIDTATGGKHAAEVASYRDIFRG